MGCRAGITTDPWRRKNEWERKYPSLSNWQEKAFSSREAAQRWENAQQSCDKSGGGNNPDNPNAKWYGYRFDY
ncbi:MAG: hypothetical protein ACR2P4_04650 [Gammaproteobacteria bacterium]